MGGRSLPEPLRAESESEYDESDVNINQIEYNNKNKWLLLLDIHRAYHARRHNPLAIFS